MSEKMAKAIRSAINVLSTLPNGMGVSIFNLDLRGNRTTAAKTIRNGLIAELESAIKEAEPRRYPLALVLSEMEEREDDNKGLRKWLMLAWKMSVLEASEFLLDSLDTVNSLQPSTYEEWAEAMVAEGWKEAE